MDYVLNMHCLFMEHVWTIHEGHFMGLSLILCAEEVP